MEIIRSKEKNGKKNKKKKYEQSFRKLDQMYQLTSQKTNREKGVERIFD